MRRVIRLSQMLKIQPRIHLGRADIGMAQQLLHGTQVLAALQNVAGKTVA